MYMLFCALTVLLSIFFLKQQFERQLFDTSRHFLSPRYSVCTIKLNID